MIGQIIVNEGGRFQVDNRELTSGDNLEVLIVDGQEEREKWIATSIEHNEQGYYLSGLFGYNPVGLFARL